MEIILICRKVLGNMEYAVCAVSPIVELNIVNCFHKKDPEAFFH
jgi:hypothetical protein